ncbi:RagB/SusD family nutrient uptake outer membrane protein [Filimonas effusa]|uniref:RagB/SusD family nutrient uptake outer membrane protein n=1 Tax=Filimonas effusa TaxID=2508721 RepID=A0A4Q1DCM1_9BACT|nr:RagB/SusD family nutrient uptake outer membrane protein [Filimonas effusa]RXK86289.1 RagB/SusD family nutrient uptake outer membrane protein [Filimonas effusa]
MLVKNIILSLLLLLVFSSCRKTLEVLPETTLDESQVYRNVYDADAAVIGIYGQLSGLARQYVVLNELRGDLLTVTSNADTSLQQIAGHRVSSGNPYADPRPFYKVILNCNDVLKNFDIMLRDKKMTTSEYNSRYADIATLRCWLYLQLGIHFGEIPYVTDAIENINDLKDASRFPRVSFRQLLTSLIGTMEGLPTLEVYPTGSTLLTTADNTITNKFFVNKQCLLGDLYLWHNDYTKAATAYRAVMETNTASGDFDTYKIRIADVASNNDLAVGYIRYREQDINALINNNTQGWKSMFIRSRDDLWNTEWLWVLPFNSNFAPEEPFAELFSPYAGYLLKPSARALHNWNSQVQNNGFPFDARGIFSADTTSAVPAVRKYTYHYNIEQPLVKNSSWFLYRAAVVHLRYAEAANRDGRGKIAWALLNTGIGSTYDDASQTDKTNLMQTFDSPPYDFDARNGTAPYFRGPWHRNGGIRGRAYLQPLSISLQQNTTALEDALVNESALELAFEGHRWPDLLRIALRRNDAGYLAAQTGDSRLLDPSNWYLPFNWNP